MIYLAADHRGFRLKEELKKFLADSGFKINDKGASQYDAGDDYVDFASAAAAAISAAPDARRGIFLCGSGHGMDIVADKFPHIRAALGFNLDVAVQSRTHDDANVLVFAADWISAEDAKEIAIVWLKTPFSGEERHARRLKKIEKIEKQNFK